MIKCPVCFQCQTEIFLERDSVVANQNLLVESFLAATRLSKGRLLLKKCNSCGFVSNAAFDPALLQYGTFYENSQDLSPAFQKHLDQLVDELVVKKGFQNHQIIEIGCGKGHFLKRLVTHPASKNCAIGFDPTYLGDLSLYEGRLQFERRFYDETCRKVKADVIICRHVIEHISSPVEFLTVIKSALADSPKARLFFETPCLHWILEQEAIWDFFYEHCSYFTQDSLSFAFEKAGFQVEKVQHVFEGQYLWLEASIGPQKRELPKMGKLFSSLERYIASENELKKRWQKAIQGLLKDGKMAIWGAGAKGVTFANLFDPKREFFDCIIDINPRKQNMFLPGTGHSIVGVEELKKRKVSTAILMNPNYFQESQKLLNEHALTTRLVII